MQDLYDKHFCELDAYAIPVIYLNDGDEELKRILSFHPKHNQYTLKNQGIDKPEEWLYNVDREIVETDRTGFRGYDKIYTKHLKKYKDKPINLLEIGIEWGYGLLGWSRLFPKANVYGMEKFSGFQNEYQRIQSMFPEESKRISFDLPYNSAEENNWKKLYGDKKFDIIIDDGAHVVGTQLNTLKCGLNFIKDNGVYFIEDIKLEYLDVNRAASFLNNLLYLSGAGFFKEIFIYKHINAERLDFIKLSDSEKMYHLYEKFMKENYHIKQEQRKKMATKDAKIKIAKDNQNYFNYSAALIK